MNEPVICEHEYAKVDFVAGYCSCGMSIEEILARARYGDSWQIATSPINPATGRFVYPLWETEEIK